MFLDVDSDSQIVLMKPGYVATNFTARNVGVLILFRVRVSDVYVHANFKDLQYVSLPLC